MVGHCAHLSIGDVAGAGFLQMKNAPQDDVMRSVRSHPHGAAGQGSRSQTMRCAFMWKHARPLSPAAHTVLFPLWPSVPVLVRACWRLHLWRVFDLLGRAKRTQTSQADQRGIQASHYLTVRSAAPLVRRTTPAQQETFVATQRRSSCF